MSSNDRIILDNVIEQRKQQIAPTLSDSDYFELFTAEQLLKDFDLSYDEIESGIIGGGGDGGIDSIFIFLNEYLLQEDTDLSGYKRNVKIEMHIIQSKMENSFSESPMDKFTAVTDDLLDFSKELSDFTTVYHKNLLETIERFRSVYKELAGKFPTLTIYYYYASKGDKPHPNVQRKVQRLAEVAKRLFSSVQVVFTFIGSRELLDLARRSPKITYPIILAENPISSSGAVGYICLVRLSEFFKFITDEEGKLHRNLFEANVRDYQGGTQVNDEIQKTLKEPQPEDFWWLNNGITIVAAKANVSGKTLMMEDPQIVNGLQTSTEIHRYFTTQKTQDDPRNVLIRVIVPNEPESRDRIIKATNSQTVIPVASLRATEKIHRDIEEYFSSHGIFYDRRKNFFKNEGKPIAKIVSIPYLAQAVMSIVLQRPNSARARPSSLLKNDAEYRKVFSSDYPINLYFVCATLMKHVETFLKSETASLDPKDRNNLRFHVAMYAAALLTGKMDADPSQLEKITISAADEAFLLSCLNEVRSIYERLGGNDQIAKGPEFVQELKQCLSSCLIK
ncbi:MAG: AIPR family protein [Candidatus Hydrothermarchaeota archaeon]